MAAPTTTLSDFLINPSPLPQPLLASEHGQSESTSGAHFLFDPPITILPHHLMIDRSLIRQFVELHDSLVQNSSAPTRAPASETEASRQNVARTVRRTRIANENDVDHIGRTTLGHIVDIGSDVEPQQQATEVSQLATWAGGVQIKVDLAVTDFEMRKRYLVMESKTPWAGERQRLRLLALARARNGAGSALDLSTLSGALSIVYKLGVSATNPLNPTRFTYLFTGFLLHIFYVDFTVVESTPVPFFRMSEAIPITHPDFYKVLALPLLTDNPALPLPDPSLIPPLTATYRAFLQMKVKSRFPGTLTKPKNNAGRHTGQIGSTSKASGDDGKKKTSELVLQVVQESSSTSIILHPLLPSSAPLSGTSSSTSSSSTSSSLIASYSQLPLALPNYSIIEASPVYCSSISTILRGTAEGITVVVKLAAVDSVGGQQLLNEIQIYRDVLGGMTCVPTFYGGWETRGVDGNTYALLILEYVGPALVTFEGLSGEEQDQLDNTLNLLHQRQVTHNDLRSSNILRRGTGELIISDFGMAEIVQGGLISEFFPWNG